MIITKSRSSVGSWPVYHASTGNTVYLALDTNAAVASAAFWNNTTPTSSVISLGSPFAGSYSLIAYCFAEVPGFSAFGSYTGNGSTDGPFVYTGFRPAFMLIKQTNSTEHWYILDAKRNTYNVVDLYLMANLSNAEATYSFGDIVSNGFKFRNTSAAINASGSTYIYMAFAENPFKYSLAR